MANSESDRSSTETEKAPRKARAKAKPRAGSGSRTNGSSAKRRSSGVRASARRAADQMPGWATSLGPVIGMGVAIGLGLFATRKQWLPQAEEWEGQLRERLSRATGSSDDYAFEDTDEFGDDEMTSAGSSRPTAPAVGAPSVPVT